LRYFTVNGRELSIDSSGRHTQEHKRQSGAGAAINGGSHGWSFLVYRKSIMLSDGILEL
jgi:hypothetical protein